MFASLMTESVSGGILGDTIMNLAKGAIDGIATDGKTLVGYSVAASIGLVCLVAGGRFAVKQVKGAISSAS